MSKQLRHEDVEQYLRFVSTQQAPYDFAGMLRLVLVGIDSLRGNLGDGDFLEYAHLITDEQATFFQNLLEHRAESKAWFINEITHSSHVLH